MLLGEICPFVRYARKQIYIGGRGAVCAYDFRLFFLHEGEGSVRVGDRVFPLAPATLLLIPPAVPYLISGERLCFTVLNFDLTFRAAERQSRHPDPVAAFVREEAHLPPACPPLTDGAICLFSFAEAEGVLFRIRTEWEEQPPFADAHISAACKGLLVLAARQSTVPENPVSPLVRQVMRFVEEHYTEPISNREIAAAFHYHPYYIGRRFAEEAGVPLHRYLTERRLRAARQMLLESDAGMEKIAAAVGFTSHAHFSKMFREVCGMVPRDFRAATRRAGI